MWHIKDMDRTTRDYTESGHGSTDYILLLAQVDTSGLEYYYMEQGGNFALDPMSSAVESSKYFREHPQRFL